MNNLIHICMNWDLYWHPNCWAFTLNDMLATPLFYSAFEIMER